MTATSNGTGLAGRIAAFLEADGYTVEHRAPHCLAAERTGASGTDRRFVWLIDPDHGVTPDEAGLLQDFAAASQVLDERSLGYLVVPSLTGLPTAFRQQANASGMAVRVPVQFFDTPYKSDDDGAFGAGRGSEARSVFEAFLREHGDLEKNRIPQPFTALSRLGHGEGGFGEGGDLLPLLVDDLTAPSDGPRLTVLIGNAGAGKSMLFAALFAALDNRFRDAKRRQQPASRPILFLPEHIRERSVRTLDGLLEAVAATDAAAPTPPALMRFLGRSGHTTWMFDGLDEFFAGETDFVAALEDCLAPASRSRVVVCARDSLLTSSTALRGLIDRQIGFGRVALYELARWERPSWRALAWTRHEGRLPPDENAADPPRVAAFLAALDASPAAAELATLPFYCDLLLGIAGRDGRLAADEFELLAAAVDAMVDREQEKLSTGELGFRWDVFSGAENLGDVEALVTSLGADAVATARDRERLLDVLQTIGRERLIELIEAIAHKMRTEEPYPGSTAGLSTEDIEDLANFYLDVDLDTAIEPRVLLALVQFAFFGPGDGEGRVRFSQEIIADFLAGREAVRILETAAEQPDAVGQALGVRRDLDRSVLLRYVVSALAQRPDLAAVVRARIEAGSVRDRSREAANHLLASMHGAGL